MVIIKNSRKIKKFGLASIDRIKHFPIATILKHLSAFGTTCSNPYNCFLRWLWPNIWTLFPSRQTEYINTRQLAHREVCDNLRSKGKNKDFLNISIHWKSSCLPPVIEYFSLFSTLICGAEILILSRDCSLCVSCKYFQNELLPYYQSV